MHTYIYLVLLTSLTLTSCATMRAPSLNMLEQRADYDASKRTSETMGELNGPIVSPRRTEAVTTDIYLHPHEMPTGDYLLGGWIRTVITQPKWEMDDGLAPTFKIEESPMPLGSKPDATTAIKK